MSEPPCGCKLQQFDLCYLYSRGWGGICGLLNCTANFGIFQFYTTRALKKVWSKILHQVHIFCMGDIMYRVVKKKIMKVSFFQYILDPLKNILTKIHDFPAFRYPVTGPKRCEKSPFSCCSVALNSPLRTIFGPFYDFSVFSESRWVSTKDRFISIAFFYLVVEESFWRSLKSEAP